MKYKETEYIICLLVIFILLLLITLGLFALKDNHLDIIQSLLSAE